MKREKSQREIEQTTRINAKQEILQILKSKGAKKETYNTNNGWGFGGIAGHIYTLSDGRGIIIGVYCYRHSGTTPAIKLVSNPGPLQQTISDSETTILNILKELKQ